MKLGSKAMRMVGNLFLLLFLADAGFSLIDELLALFFTLTAFSALRHAVAATLLVLSSVIYLAFGIDKRLPKRVFLPLVLYVWLRPTLLWLFPALNGLPTFGMLAAIGQIGLFLLTTSHFRRSNGRSFLLPERLFREPHFSWKNSLIFSGVNLFIGPCLLVLMVLTTADGFVRRFSSGFMHIGPDGLHMYEKVYRRGEKTVRLAGMIHMGEKQYYEKIGHQEQLKRAIVLAEGVTDSRHLLHNRLDYGRFAGSLGLTTQDSRLFSGRVIDDAALDQGTTRGPVSFGNGPDVLRADVDISSFRPSTVYFLDELGKQMARGGTLKEQILNLTAWSEKTLTPQMQQLIFDDILHRRNLELLGYLDKALPQYDVVIIPWGALHMTEIEAAVVKKGFHLEQVNDTISIHFFKKNRKG